MAAAILRDLVKKEDLSDKIEVDSGGIDNWHIGKLPHEGTRSLLEREMISYEGMLARQVVENDWDDFDYIIAMDDQNMEDLGNIRKVNDSIVVARLMNFVENPAEVNVPDPYYTGNFEYTYQLGSAGCTHLLNYLKDKHQF